MKESLPTTTGRLPLRKQGWRTALLGGMVDKAFLSHQGGVTCQIYHACLTGRPNQLGVDLFMRREAIICHTALASVFEPLFYYWPGI